MRNFLYFKKTNGLFVICTCFIKHKFGLQKLFGCRSIFPLCQTPSYKIINLRIINSFKGFWKISINNFSIYLRWILTFSVRGFLCEHFKNCHSKRVYINLSSIMLFIKFWCHEFWSSKDRASIRIFHCC